MSKEARIEEKQRLTCPNCGNDTKFRGENTKRKVVYQNFKFTDYKRLHGPKNEERNVVTYSPNYFEDGEQGFDIIYCGSVECYKKHGERTIVYRRHGAKPFAEVIEAEEAEVNEDD